MYKRALELVVWGVWAVLVLALNAVSQDSEHLSLIEDAAGMFNEMSFFNGMPEALPDVVAKLDRWGGPETFPCR